MRITVIGHGNVGGALAAGWARAGHQVTIGARDLTDAKLKALLQANPGIEAIGIAQAAQAAEVVVIAAVPPAVHEIADHIRSHVSEKIVIETMNSVSRLPDGYPDTYTALRALLPEADLVKCFNSTGFENMAHPDYGNGLHADMFMAGGSLQAKAFTRQLALDLGFAACHDFGGEQQVPLLEQFAFCWINLAFRQGLGRDFIFKIHTR